MDALQFASVYIFLMFAWLFVFFGLYAYRPLWITQVIRYFFLGVFVVTMLLNLNSSTIDVWPKRYNHTSVSDAEYTGLVLTYMVHDSVWNVWDVGCNILHSTINSAMVDKDKVK